MTSHRTMTLFGAALLALSAPLSAQTTTEPAFAASTIKANSFKSTTTTDNRATVGELIGQDLTNAYGESIGEIDDIVQIRGETMAVVGVGGFLGFGERDIALPITELSLRDRHIAARGYTLDQLKSMEDFRAELAEPLETDTMVAFGSS